MLPVAKSVINDEVRKKIAMFCDVREHAIIESTTVDNIYELPLILQGTRFPDNYALHKLNIDLPEADMSEWKAMIEKGQTPGAPSNYWVSR